MLVYQRVLKTKTCAAQLSHRAGCALNHSKRAPSNCANSCNDAELLDMLSTIRSNALMRASTRCNAILETTGEFLCLCTLHLHVHGAAGIWMTPCIQSHLQYVANKCPLHPAYLLIVLRVIWIHPQTLKNALDMFFAKELVNGNLKTVAVPFTRKLYQSSGKYVSVQLTPFGNLLYPSDTDWHPLEMDVEMAIHL